MKGFFEVVGVFLCWIIVDGRDVIDVMINFVNLLWFKDLRVIFFKGIIYVGFNVVDFERFYNEMGFFWW